MWRNSSQPPIEAGEFLLEKLKESVDVQSSSLEKIKNSSHELRQNSTENMSLANDTLNITGELNVIAQRISDDVSSRKF